VSVPDTMQDIIMARLDRLGEDGKRTIQLASVKWTVFVTREGRGSVTEEHRQAIERWLAARPEVKTVQIGPLVDAWYPT
jgi:uncharacterized protein YggL (DUF469 family)